MTALVTGCAVLYKATDHWYPKCEQSILWNDPAFGINCPFSGLPLLAAKEANGE